MTHIITQYRYNINNRKYTLCRFTLNTDLKVGLLNSRTFFSEKNEYIKTSLGGYILEELSQTLMGRKYREVKSKKVRE